MKPIRRRGVARRRSGNKSAAVAVSLRKRRKGIVYQQDLEEALFLKRLAREAQERLAAAENVLRTKLEAGAAVEPGFRTAKMKVVLGIE